jgi:hypothetical protein
MKVILINMYRSPTRIFMNDDGSFFELLSREGTTQGCPLAMAMYALALIPLIQSVKSHCKQVWYADDATGCDRFAALRTWFDWLLIKGPVFGYFPKPAKCILVTKPDRVEEAQKYFKNTGVEIVTDGSKATGVEVYTEGTRHLGAAIGTQEFKVKFVEKKVAGWIASLEKLSEIAKTERTRPSHTAFKVSGPFYRGLCQGLNLSCNLWKM